MAGSKYDRRRFLGQAAAGATGAALWNEAVDATEKPKRRPQHKITPDRKFPYDADVLVIGAGMAGVVAARALQPHRRVIVLEGRPDRIGGRIWTSFKWPDEPVDLGASWLSHEQVNPLRVLANRLGIRTVPSQLTNLALFTADGQRFSEKDLGDFEDLFGELVADVKLLGLARQVERLGDIPASQAFATVLGKKNFTASQLSVIHYFMDHVFQQAQACPLSDLSTFGLAEDAVSFQGVQTASIIPEGYVQFIDFFAAGLDIRLGHVVETITYSKNGVAVTLADGTTLRARYCVVTLPLGVLKSGAVTFVPALPPWKQAAIQRVGFGSTEKIYFRFPSVFWPPDKDSVDRIPPTLEGQWSAFFNFHKYTGGPNGEPGLPTLLSFNHAPFGPQLERMSDQQVMELAYAALKPVYKTDATRPIAMQRSRWASDPFARGVVPHTPPGSTSRDFDIIGLPVANRLFFAGDGTTSGFTGFVLGAYQTGLREAQRILKLH